MNILNIRGGLFLVDKNLSTVFVLPQLISPLKLVMDSSKSEMMHKEV